MFSKSHLFCAGAVLALCANALPALEKRIAQTIADSTTKWVAACTAAGGGEKCGTTSQTAFMTLLAGAGDCDQQNAADAMIDLAKSLAANANTDKMITLAQPRNPELRGLFQCQFQSVDPTTFTGGVKVGGEGTVPLGLTGPVQPPGSCPAHRGGGVADGTQLVDVTQDPGVASTGTANVGGTSDSGSSGSGSDAGPGAGSSTVHNCAAATTPATPSASPAPAAASSGGFKLQNGKDAQAQNAKFASLSDSSTCTAGEQACIGGGFAQCVTGKFVTTQCAGGTSCFALPLVNKPGTSIACTTEGDAVARIGATGAVGGVTGSS